MTYPVDAALLQLQREYLGSMPQKLDELRSDIAALGRSVPRQNLRCETGFTASPAREAHLASPS